MVNIMWIFSDIFQILNVVYPILLIIYYTKLSDLKKNKTFAQVKRWINRAEFTLILISTAMIVFTTVDAILPRILEIAYR